MKKEEREPVIRRILVALDGSQHSLAALAAAAELAARLKAELAGLFVEDINLLQLAGLPFAQEIRYPSAIVQPIESLKLEQELKAQAAQAQRTLAVTAAQVKVAWSFRVVRGYVTAEVLTAALEADLLSLGIASGPLARRRRLGSTARTVAVEAPRAVLLLQHGDKIRLPIMVTYDGSAAARQAITIAAHLVQTTEPIDRPALIVLILTDPETLETADHLEREVTAWLQERGLQAIYRRLTRSDIWHLTRLVQIERGGLLVLAGEKPSIQAEAIQMLLDMIDCPILLVRSLGEETDVNPA